MLITCGCGKKLRVNDNLAGKRIKCPGCAQAIVVPKVEDVEEELPTLPSADDDDVAEQQAWEARRRRQRQKLEPKPSVNVALIAAIGGGAVILLLFCFICFLLLFRGRATQQAAVSPGPQTRPPASLPTPAATRFQLPNSELGISRTEDPTHYIISITNSSRDFDEFRGTVKWFQGAYGTNASQGLNRSTWKKGEVAQVRLGKREDAQSVRLEGWGKTATVPPAFFDIHFPIPGFATAPETIRSSPAQDPNGSFPLLTRALRLAPGIKFHQNTILRNQVPMRVWVYLPEKAVGNVPSVLIAPAGSPLFTGMRLEPNDRQEHLPYVRAGFAVVAFDLDGPMPENATNQQVMAAATAFRKADAGGANARAALDFAMARVPALDANRIWVAGHSSAATLALLVAANEPRIKACVAYAPVTDAVKRLSSQPGYPQLCKMLPWLTEFTRDTSPRTHIGEIKCPVFLFHASDDNNIPVSESISFASDLKQTNPQVTLVQVPRGGHFDSMIKQGIPQAIDWLKKLSP